MDAQSKAELAQRFEREGQFDKACAIVRAFRRDHENTAAAIREFDSLSEVAWLKLRWAAKIRVPSNETIQFARAMLVELLPGDERGKLELAS